MYADSDITTGTIGYECQYFRHGLTMPRQHDLTTGTIDGTISAEATNGSFAYGMYAGSDITVNGDIGYNAEITALAGVDDAAGLYSSGGSIIINGAI